ncbi:hypothetical protein N9Y92_00075 [Chlamydiales bacterium]|nr:hypothetical protein [Chlamydiales bacterium]
MKKTLFIIIVFLFVSGRLWFYLTDGFTISNISSELPSISSFEVKQSDYSPLNQKFTYLGKGCQSYVFLSNDGQYVLKFFKFKHLTPPLWTYFLPFGEGAIKKKEEKRNHLFNGCAIAFRHCMDECGLVAMHLVKEKVPFKEVDLIDKMGFHHTIDPSQYAFYIQRFGHSFLNKITTSESSDLKKIILDVICLMKKRSLKGVRDCDPALIQNLAIVDGAPIFIDLGQFIKDESIVDPANMRNDFKEKLGPLIFNSDALLKNLFSAEDGDIFD